MYRIFSALIEIAAAAVFIIPISACCNKFLFHAWKRTVFYVIFAFYLTAILALTGFPNITSLKLDLTVNFIPFTDMASDFVNACLNVLLFIPFGFFVPILWSKFRSVKSILPLALTVICVIEASQIFTFRTTDINDFITNTAGTVIGFFIAKLATKNFTRHVISNAKSSDLYIIFGTVGFTMFFLQPFVSSVLWKIAL